VGFPKKKKGFWGGVKIRYHFNSPQIISIFFLKSKHDELTISSLSSFYLLLSSPLTVGLVLNKSIKLFVGHWFRVRYHCKGEGWHL